MQHITKYEFCLFADYTSLIHSNKKLATLIEEVNDTIYKISSWFNTNKLSLSIKNNSMLFTSANKKPNVPINAIQINGSSITQVSFTKFLGVYVDEHLNWSMHLYTLAAKLARNVGILGKLVHVFPVIYLKNSLLLFNITALAIL